MEKAKGKWIRKRSDSAENSVEEHLKRKRKMLGKKSIEREEGLADIFRRSKKVATSPGRKEKKKEGKGVDLKGMLKKMGEELREGLRKIRQEIREASPNGSYLGVVGRLTFSF